MQKCPDCQAIVDDEAIFCDQCGLRLKPAPGPSTAIENIIAETLAKAAPSANLDDEPSGNGVACPSCGYVNLPGESFCSNCGFQLPSREQVDGFEEAPASLATGVQAEMVASNADGSQERVSKSCPNCGFVNPLGETYCQNCGFWLTQEPYFAASQADVSGNLPEPAVSLPTPPAFETEAAIQSIGHLFSPATNASLTLPVQPEIIIGRHDPERGIFPDVDLGNQGSASNSISRRHARLLLQAGQIYVEDLNSTNATYLNRQRLQPGQRHLLKDGDELRLGGVVLIYFA